MLTQCHTVNTQIGGESNVTMQKSYCHEDYILTEKKTGFNLKMGALTSFLYLNVSFYFVRSIFFCSFRSSTTIEACLFDQYKVTHTIWARMFYKLPMDITHSSFDSTLLLIYSDLFQRSKTKKSEETNKSGSLYDALEELQRLQGFYCFIKVTDLVFQNSTAESQKPFIKSLKQAYE